MAISLEDDRFHRRNDDPYWNESSIIVFQIPERKIGGHIYFYHRPNMNLSVGGPALWGPPGGEEIYDCLYWDWDTCQSLPAGAEMYDFSLRNSLTVRTIELQRSYHITYDRQGFAMDVVWDAIAPPHPYTHRTPREADRDFALDGWLEQEGVQELPMGHYEQAGYLRGTIRLDGETIDIDCLCFRDRTWGPRKMDRHLRGSWTWGYASETDYFHTYSFTVTPIEADPIFDTTELVTYGMLCQDGVVGDIVEGKRRAVERDDNGLLRLDVIDATDHLGRTLHVEARPETRLKWTGYTEHFCWYNQGVVEFNGHRTWGLVSEYYPFAHARKLHRMTQGVQT